MNSSTNTKRGGALIASAKVLIITVSLAATVGGWAAMSAPASAATTSTATTSTANTAATTNQTGSSSNNLTATLAQLINPAPSSVQSQPVVRTRSSR